jgi:hypothetical protein
MKKPIVYGTPKYKKFVEDTRKAVLKKEEQAKKKRAAKRKAKKILNPTSKVKKPALKKETIDWYEFYNYFAHKGMQLDYNGNARFDVKSKIESYY